MAALLLQSTLSSSIRPVKLGPCHRQRWQAAFQAPKSLSNKHDLPSIPMLQSFAPSKELKLTEVIMENRIGLKEEQDGSLISAKLLAIAEAAVDRAEMHAIIGEQRNNWSHLFLHSINSLTLTASLMAGLANIAGLGATLPLNLSSAILLSSAAGIMLIINKIQPSQLAEEQRNASRLFKQLERSIHATLGTVSDADEADVDEVLEKVIALQKAYPLPLLPGMLEKFPESVEPTKWWPEQRRQQQQKVVGRNGWSPEMEQEMSGVLRVLKAKDVEQYVRFGQLVLKINKTLAFAGPVLAGFAAAAAAATSIGLMNGSLPAAVGGALAAVVNTLEHGGQVGMVFELSRNCAGFYRRLEEDIEFNLREEEQMREQGDLFELKMALQLGRSIAELREFASTAGKEGEAKDFAGKLF